MRQILDSIAILDLDGEGQIIDTDARSEEAKRITEAHFSAKGETLPAPDTNAYKGVFYGRNAFFNESLLYLDRLQHGAIQAITRLRELYTDIYILTSRPDFLADPTLRWLKDHGIDLAEDEIRFKLYQRGDDKREQYVGTAAWKLIIVHQAAWVYKQVLFVDNEEKNRKAVEALNLPNITIKDSLKDFIVDDGPIIV